MNQLSMMTLKSVARSIATRTVVIRSVVTRNIATRSVATCLGIASLAVICGSVAHAQVITDWNFGTVAVTAPDNTPTATTGTGSASSLGMTNSYTYSTSPPITGSVTYDDITNDTGNFGAVGNNGNGDVWRIRGEDTSSIGNGWNNAAPEYSQGAQFLVSTAGYSNIGLSFEWASTTQGIANMQVQYTTNGSTWSNVGSLLTATIDSTAGGGYQIDTLNFAALGITSVANDANFGVRLVSAYDPSLAGGTEYASATSVLAGSPVQYNNNSGNWRFADVQIDGSPVPLPASAWLMVSALGGLGSVTLRRRKSAG
ncbi:MAG: VPLPA-CTERM sorting domain-containing protein [Steroidobacteraceae bacterium]|jgi:hypothetical protein